MFVGNQHIATSTVPGILEFSCRFCSFEGPALVLGQGEGSRFSPLALADSLAANAAEEAANDAARANRQVTLNLARCPKCGLRDQEKVDNFWSKEWLKIMGISFGIGTALILFMTLVMEEARIGGKFFFPTVGVGVVLALILMASQYYSSTLPKWKSVDERVIFDFDLEKLQAQIERKKAARSTRASRERRSSRTRQPRKGDS